MIEWTEQALRQLDQVHDYIALSNCEDVAGKITLQILAGIQQLDAFPMSGRPGLVKGTRELVVSNAPFIAAYAISQRRVVILALYHGAQRWPETFWGRRRRRGCCGDRQCLGDALRTTGSDLLGRVISGKA